MADDGEHIDFFVSYTGDDEPWALWISRVLEETGYRVLVQARDFGPGLFPVAMEQAVQQTRLLVPVLSDSYLKSKYGLQEWAAFAGTPEQIIPVKVQDVVTRSLLGPLVRVSMLNLDEAHAAQHLCEQMAHLAYPPSGKARAWTGPRAPFPATAEVVAPGGDEPGGEPAPQRILPDPGALQLVLLGPHADALRGFARHAATMDPHTQDLAGSTLPPTEQLSAIEHTLAQPDREAVTDVLVVFAGEATVDPIEGTRLRFPTDVPGEAAALLGLGELLALLTRCARNRRVYLVLDAADAGGTSVLAPDAMPRVPILDLRRPSLPGEAAVGLAGLSAALASPAAQLGARLKHAAALTLGDLATLSNGVLRTPTDWPGAHVGLLRSPLAWPFAIPNDLPRWCVVLSSADAARANGAVAGAMLALGRFDSDRLSKVFAAAGRPVELEKEVAPITAAEVFASPASFAAAVAKVCAANIAIFDVTDYEPAVMVLLGVRAAVRRGVSLCVHTAHADPWRDVSAPFHLREISLLTALDEGSLFTRLRAGIRQLTQPEHAYTDLPSFEPLRAVPTDPAWRGNRPIRSVADPTVLGLVPFDVRYTAKNWKHLQENLPKEARPHLLSEETQLRVQRTLDLESPRVVSAQLYEAIRLTDFCLVDLTLNRPNVLFELGVRLAVNPLHPVVVLHRADKDLAQSAAMVQRDHLATMLAAIEYTPSFDDLASIGSMVNRHIELVNIDGNRERPPRERTVLNGFPPRGVFDLAWRFAAVSDETVTVSVAARLEGVADGMLPNPKAGSVQLLYPAQHPLRALAARSGREHLVAAWLYQYFRLGGPRHPDAGERTRYENLTARLLERLSLATDEDSMALADQVEQWHTDAKDHGDQQ